MIRTFLTKLFVNRASPWWERYFLLLLAAGAVIFMIISMAIGLHQSVWFDEAFSILLAKQSAAHLVHLTTLDTHPPLYYLLLKAWGDMFGWSEFALRGLSVLAAGISIIFGGLLVKRVFGTRAAYAALPFIVFAPFLLRYGFEIRMYALASLIGIMATYVLVLATQTKAGRDQMVLYGVYGLLVTLGVYTLYYTVLLWIAHLLWLLWLTHHRKQSIVRSPWVKAFGLSILLFLPWMPAFISQIGNGSLAAISVPLTVDNLAGIVSFAFVYQPAWQLGALTSLIVVFVIATITYFTVQAFKVVSEKQRPYLVLLAMYLGVPVALMALVSLVAPVYVERYLSHVMLGGMLFVGVVTWFTVTKARRYGRNSMIAACALVAILFIGITHLAQIGNFNFQRLQDPMTKEAAAAMADCQGNDGASVFASTPYVAIELSYYLPSCQINFSSTTATLKGGYGPLSNSPLRVTNASREFALSHKVYYVYYSGDPLSTMPSTLHQTALSTYGGLNVATYSVK